jgi:lysophospholipase L1-like esterase
MSIDLRYSRLIGVVLGPIVLLQARSVRKVIPHLPDAALPWSGRIPGDDPISILVLGDSTAAGVGATTQDDALPGHLARALAEEWERGVAWRAIGENGATSEDIVRRFLDAASAERYDVVFVTIGANDAIQLRSRSAFRRNFRTILHRLRSVNPNALVLVSSLPGFSQFVALPNPLRWALHLHARSLEAVAGQGRARDGDGATRTRIHDRVLRKRPLPSEPTGLPGLGRIRTHRREAPA